MRCLWAEGRTLDVCRTLLGCPAERSQPPDKPPFALRARALDEPERGGDDPKASLHEEHGRECGFCLPPGATAPCREQRRGVAAWSAARHAPPARESAA